jgi:hypothetical protein
MEILRHLGKDKSTKFAKWLLDNYKSLLKIVKMT